MNPDFFHEGMRRAQAQMDSTRLADRINELKTQTTIQAQDRAIIESCSMVFVATADTHGNADCSYKGGAIGFIRVADERTLMIPFYDGNGQYRTIGNMLVNPSVGLLFVDFVDKDRLRVNGTATVVRPEDDEELVHSFVGAELVVVVTVRHVFGNCSRYINDPVANNVSEFAPQPGHTPPQPKWKSRQEFREVLPKVRQNRQ